jgi:hypothetical protein
VEAEDVAQLRDGNLMIYPAGVLGVADGWAEVGLLQAQRSMSLTGVLPEM